MTYIVNTTILAVKLTVTIQIVFLAFFVYETSIPFPKAGTFTQRKSKTIQFFSYTTDNIKNISLYYHIMNHHSHKIPLKRQIDCSFFYFGLSIAVGPSDLDSVTGWVGRVLRPSREKKKGRPLGGLGKLIVRDAPCLYRIQTPHRRTIFECLARGSCGKFTCRYTVM